MKLLVLCNDRMALPALNRLFQLGSVAGVGMPARETEVSAVVKMLCGQYKVPLHRFRKNTFHTELGQLLTDIKPEAVFVKTFPWKIPEEVLALPSQGFINFHYAPLPEYRGPNPLFWMLKDGVKETGVTVHRMTAEFDEGPILFKSTIPIHPGITFGMLCSQLGFNGLELTDKVLQALSSGTLIDTVQETSGAGWYKRPQPQDLWIDWNTQNAESVKRLVSACNPWNKGAATKIDGWMLGLSYVTPVNIVDKMTVAPGTILCIDEQYGLCIACAGNTAIRADVVYTEEGFLPGFALKNFGLAQGRVFSR
jgi:methionyl-tRNA formyltransferase